MRVVFGFVLILGMGLAGFAVYMAKDYIGNYQAALATERAARSQMVETVGVFVSKRSLKYGERLREKDVRVVRWPVNAIPEGVFQSEKDLFPQGPDVTRTVIRAMEKDEAILAIKVTGPGQDAGVSSRLGKGMRAFAIKVDVTSGVSGFLRPGDRVDVYWTGRRFSPENSQNGGELTKLIETAITLMAIDQTADGDRNTATIARTVTVEVTPRQVAALAQAQGNSRLSLALVGDQEKKTAAVVEVDGRDLLGIQERKVVQAIAPRVCSIKTRRGAEIIQTPVACPTEN